MIKLTLDTNCIINLLDYKSESATSIDEITEILRYGLEGDVNIAITTRVDSDVSKDKNQDRKIEILKRISMFPTIGTVARLDSSKFDSGDVLVGQEHQALEDEIKKIVFPNIKKDDPHYDNKINDIDHLIGHKINQRDIFITDDQQILRKVETLESSIGIKVMDPGKALEYINLQANQVVLAQEFYEKFEEYKNIVITAMNSSSINADQLARYEELRNWMIRKLPAINDGLLNFKFQMMSVPTGVQRIFGKDDLVSLQTFKNQLNGMIKQRDPLKITRAVSTFRFNYSYRSEKEQIDIAISFLNSLEDDLLGYLGALETK